MIPRLAREGKSFKGAGVYYLHDKGAKTSDRVAFTHALNTAKQDAQGALNEMAFVAMHQDELKRAHYRLENPHDPDCRDMRKTGRKVKNSVLHYSLSWHPSEKPTREHMIEAAQSSLRKLGLEEHQCLLVAHNDEPHPHIHLIVNKIHPETGKVAALKYTKDKLQAWAKAYEEEHDKIWCDARYEERPKVAFANAHNDNRVERKRKKGGSQADYYRWKRLEKDHNWELDKEARASLWRDQQQIRKRLFKLRDEDLAAAKDRVREEMRPHWANHYRRECSERRLFEHNTRTAIKRLQYFVRNGKDCVRFEGGWLSAAWMAITQPQLLRQRFESKLKQRRDGLAAEHGRRAKEAVREVYDKHRARMDELKATQAKQRAAQREEQRVAREERASTAPERYREEKVAKAIAKARFERDGTAPITANPETAKTPAPPAEAPRVEARPAEPARDTENRTADKAPANDPQQQSKPAQRRPSRRFPSPSKDALQQEDRLKPWVPYAHVPQLTPHPHGLRQHAASEHQQQQRSNLDRKTLQQVRDAHQRAEDAELIQMFGSISRAESAKTTRAHGNSIQKSNRQGRGRRRTFDG